MICYHEITKCILVTLTNPHTNISSLFAYVHRHTIPSHLADPFWSLLVLRLPAPFAEWGLLPGPLTLWQCIHCSGIQMAPACSGEAFPPWFPKCLGPVCKPRSRYMGKIYVTLRYLRHYYSCFIFLTLRWCRSYPCRKSRDVLRWHPKKSEPQHLCLRFDEGCFEHLYCQYIGICHCQALLSFCSEVNRIFSQWYRGANLSWTGKQIRVAEDAFWQEACRKEKPRSWMLYKQCSSVYQISSNCVSKI